MSISGVAFTMYPVSDVARAAQFYRDVLGFRQDGVNQPFWVEFELGGTAFGLGNGPDTGKPGSAQSLVVEVDGLREYVNLLRERGLAPSDIVETPFACLFSSVRDPDNNIIWFHEQKRTD